jgi:HTH-type transcriptional regulator, sugar sensing transcriptional regulator
MATENDDLAGIGFSALEAGVYTALLRDSPGTGYNVAQLLRKPVSNTYKALESLCRKGCVVVDRTRQPRRYSALPLSEYFDRLEREFSKKREAVEARLRSLAGPASYPGIYRLDNLDQVYERAVRVIEGARKSILLDAFPVQVEKLRKALARAVRRHVRVMMKGYAPVTMPGVDLVISDLGPEVPSWPGELLFVVADGSDYLLAFVHDASGRVLEAVWSQNLYLAIIAYNGLLGELLWSRLLGLIGDGPEYARLRRMMATYKPLRTHCTPAFRAFVRKFESKGG